MNWISNKSNISTHVRFSVTNRHTKRRKLFNFMWYWLLVVQYPICHYLSCVEMIWRKMKFLQFFVLFKQFNLLNQNTLCSWNRACSCVIYFFNRYHLSCAESKVDNTCSYERKLIYYFTGRSAFCTKYKLMCQIESPSDSEQTISGFWHYLNYINFYVINNAAKFVSSKKKSN